MKKNIRNFTLEELKKEFVEIGESVLRAEQVFKWTNQKTAADFSEMTNIPKTLRSKLDEKYRISEIICGNRVKSRDGTEKFLWNLEDGTQIESVLIRAKNRKTICISTQVGCKFKCPFCASGMNGFVRDLEVSEIVGQILSVQRLCGLEITNVVFMGMGEPLDNYDNLIKAIQIINHRDGIGIGARKITISTCGVVPKILALKDLGLQVELSISLHSAVNGIRDELVPINKVYPLERLTVACKEYHKKTGRIITLEYTLIKGKNDSLKDAERLARFARQIRAKINLIVCNAFDGSVYKGSEEKKAKEFKDYLEEKGSKVTIRKSKGEDILAACGQLSKQGVLPGKKPAD